MASLPGQYTGFGHYSYPKQKHQCVGEGCKHADGAHTNNHFVCKPCTTVQWFENYIVYFRGDDIARADARMRLAIPKPLPVHREVKKARKEFVARGGSIHMLGNPKDMPALTWSTGPVKFVACATYPSHLITTH